MLFNQFKIEKKFIFFFEKFDVDCFKEINVITSQIARTIKVNFGKNIKSCSELQINY